MDLTYPPEAEAFRTRVRAFLAEHLPEAWRGVGSLSEDEQAEFLPAWRDVLHTSGYLAVNWPTAYGGADLSPLEVVVLAEEFATAGAPLSPAPTDGFGIALLGNTLLHWGTESQKRRFLPRILSGEDRWCQGYSEPNAGSDLANLSTRARPEGDVFVINGQKIWTSEAHRANWIFMLVRTDPGSARHHGITMLLVPLDQSGIEIRPIRDITGGEELNEVFFTDAMTSAENVVGEVGEGWKVAMTLLGYERGAAVAYTATHAFGSLLEITRLVSLARDLGRDRDPLIRQRLAWCYSKAEIMRFLGLRNFSSLVGTVPAGPEGYITKLYAEEYFQAVSELAMDILGIRGSAPTGSAPRTFGPKPLGTPNSSASWAMSFLTARAGTIYGGSAEIQRNIIGERALGLPREPRAPARDLDGRREPVGPMR